LGKSQNPAIHPHQERRIQMNIVDLTYTIENGMTTFPVSWHPFVEVTMLGRHGIENRETRKLVLGTHTGTHCDAPRHFIPGAGSVDEIPLDLLVGPATILDFTKVPESHEIQPAELEERLGDRRPKRLILRFDWCDHWGNMKYYDDHPFLSTASAQLLIDRGVKLLAMDTPMPDDPKNGKGCAIDSPNHQILLGNDCILVEYLCGLRQLAKSEVQFICMPLKIKDGDGAPARCVAIED
jgi:arylformamidase